MENRLNNNIKVNNINNNNRETKNLVRQLELNRNKKICHKILVLLTKILLIKQTLVYKLIFQVII